MGGLQLEEHVHGPVLEKGHVEVGLHGPDMVQAALEVGGWFGLVARRRVALAGLGDVLFRRLVIWNTGLVKYLYSFAHAFSTEPGSHNRF